MRRLLRWPVALAIPFRVVAAVNDERNARRLARHLDCTMGEARTLYRLARRDGYGAAYDAVFPPAADAGHAMTELPAVPESPGAQDELRSGPAA